MVWIYIEYMIDQNKMDEYLFDHNRTDDLEMKKVSFIEYLQNPKESRISKFKYMSVIYNYRHSYFWMWKTMEFHRNILLESYELMFDENLPLTDNSNCITFFLGCDSRLDGKPELEDRILNYLTVQIGIITDHQQLYNIKDIILCNRPNFNALKREINQRIHVLDQIRELTKLPTFYTDGQNVHNSTIQSNIRIEQIKLKHDDDYLEILLEIRRKILPHNKSDFTLNDNFISNQLDTIETDVSSQKLQDTLVSVWKQMKDSKYFEELIIRLKEELMDMRGKCITGQSTRLFNVLSGFIDNPIIKFSIKDEINAKWSGEIRKLISNDEELMDGLLDGNKKFIDSIEKFKIEFCKMMRIEYKDFDSKELDDVLKSLKV